MHKICELYKKVYLFSSQIPKRDRFGIYAKVEMFCLDINTLLTTAALESKTNKLPFLNSARIKIEVLKRLFRIMLELNIIKDKKYIEIESDLQEISRMTNGWIRYLTQTPR